MNQLSKMEQLHGDLYDVLGEEHCTEVQWLLGISNDLHRAKEATYDKSFARRGLIGIWHNVARKYDVIDHLGRRSAYTTAMIDALMDVAVYALKLVVTIKKIKPEVFQDWYDNVYLHFVEGEPGLTSSDGKVYTGDDGQEITYDPHTDEQKVDYPNE